MSEPRSGSASPRAASPFHCPFCAETDLFPREEPGGWECRACLRAFAVTFLGQVSPTGGPR